MLEGLNILGRTGEWWAVRKQPWEAEADWQGWLGRPPLHCPRPFFCPLSTVPSKPAWRQSIYKEDVGFHKSGLCRQWQGLRLKLGGGQNLIIYHVKSSTPRDSHAPPHRPCLGRSHPGGLSNKQAKRKWLPLFCTCPKTSDSD